MKDIYDDDVERLFVKLSKAMDRQTMDVVIPALALAVSRAISALPVTMRIDVFITEFLPLTRDLLLAYAEDESEATRQ